MLLAGRMLNFHEIYSALTNVGESNDIRNKVIMTKQSPVTFWILFRDFADSLSDGDISDDSQNELLSQLHAFDNRLYFLMSINSNPRELIITVEGDADAITAADELLSAVPKIDNWQLISLKPAMGFDFDHRDGSISLDVRKLWFMPTNSADVPPKLGVILGFPDADYVLENQSIDTAYTILETGIGERSCIADIHQVTVDDLPDNPEANGYFPLPRIAEYITFHKRHHRLE